MKEKFLKPRAGLIVRFPKTKVKLPDEGMLVPWSGQEGTYWRRRLKCGDCIEVVNTVKRKKIKEG